MIQTLSFVCLLLFALVVVLLHGSRRKLDVIIYKYLPHFYFFIAIVSLILFPLSSLLVTSNAILVCATVWVVRMRMEGRKLRANHVQQFSEALQEEQIKTHDTYGGLESTGLSKK